MPIGVARSPPEATVVLVPAATSTRWISPRVAESPVAGLRAQESAEEISVPLDGHRPRMAAARILQAEAGRARLGIHPGDASEERAGHVDRATTNAAGPGAQHGRVGTPPKVPTRRPLWAELLQRVFEVDALRCPRCGRRMRVLAAITEVDVARRIRACLNGPSRAPPLARSGPAAGLVPGRTTKSPAPAGTTPSGLPSSSTRAPPLSGTSAADRCLCDDTHPARVAHPDPV